MSAHNSSWWIIYTRIPKIIELYDILINLLSERVSFFGSRFFINGPTDQCSCQLPPLSARYRPRELQQIMPRQRYRQPQHCSQSPTWSPGSCGHTGRSEIRQIV